MCGTSRRSTTSKPPATDDEIQAAALQYVRKVSGSQKPSKANEFAFGRAIEEIAASTRTLLAQLVTTAPPRDRDVEAARTGQGREALRASGVAATPRRARRACRRGSRGTAEVDRPPTALDRVRGGEPAAERVGFSRSQAWSSEELARSNCSSSSGIASRAFSAICTDRTDRGGTSGSSRTRRSTSASLEDAEAVVRHLEAEGSSKRVFTPPGGPSPPAVPRRAPARARSEDDVQAIARLVGVGGQATAVRGSRQWKRSGRTSPSWSGRPAARGRNQCQNGSERPTTFSHNRLWDSCRVEDMQPASGVPSSSRASPTRTGRGRTRTSP